MKKRSIKWVLILLILVVLVVAGQLLLGGGGQPTYAQATATTGTLTTYYNFSGSMEIDRSVTVTAPAQATVSEIYVRANTTVPKNARLMRLSDGTVLKADIAGEITSINVSVDSPVQQGDTLAEIMDLSNMKVTFKVDEYDISAITLGKSAQITLDGSGNTFEGKVTALNKRATQSGDLSYYQATIDLTHVALPADALPGMQVTVKLLNQQAENVVLLPVDAVSFTSQNLPYVLIGEGKDVSRVDIGVGINDGDYVEITSGLASGDVVLYTPTATESFPMMMGGRRYAQ